MTLVCEPMQQDRNQKKADIIICCPVYNDWDSAVELLYQIDKLELDSKIIIDLLFIDDKSSDTLPQNLRSHLRTIRNVNILQLRRNLGHQRAIAIGLSYIATERNCNAVIVMDADGEDSPVDIPKLLNKLIDNGSSRAVFAKRKKRTDSIVFKMFYKLYKLIHRVLTGYSVEVGNFSIVPIQHIHSLVIVSDLWNHYAASLYQSKIPVETISAERSYRIAGKSKMNFSSLVTHGMSAISVYSELIGVRVLTFISAITFIDLLFLVLASFVHFFTDQVLATWVFISSGVLLVILLQILGISLVYALFVLQGRSSLAFIPLRDFRYFISSILEIKHP